MNNKCRGPDFIGIGVPKAGTTWVDSILRNHPDVWVPPVKEIHFFDDYYRDEIPNGLGRYFSQDSYVRNRCRRNFKAVVKNAIRFPSVERSRWAARFLGQKMSFEWYERLFPESGDMRGEITPDYCILKTHQILEIYQHFPKLKLLIMIRNPVERAWSHCRMELYSRLKRTSSEVSETEIERFLFSDDGVLARSEFSRVISSWSEVFGQESLFVGLLDDLISAPATLAAGLLNFLEVDEHFCGIEDLVARRVHEGTKIEIPPHIRKMLVDFYRQEIQRTAELLPSKNVEQLWLDF